MLSNFDLEVFEKRKVARGARYKKGGSKSKKCPLPTDYLTPKQIAEKGGPIVSVNLNRPMDWKTFKTLSKETQFDYVYSLIDKYNVNAAKLGEMFGVQGWTITLYFREHGIPITFSKGARMSRDDMDAWQDFLVYQQGDTIKEEFAAAEPATGYVAPRDPEPVQEVKQHISLVDLKPQPAATGMRSFTIQFDGLIDANRIYNSIKCLLGDSSYGELVINCNLAKEM